MITNCPKCGTCYEEQSEEEANSPKRECMDCWMKDRTEENLRFRVNQEMRWPNS